MNNLDKHVLLFSRASIYKREFRDSICSASMNVIILINEKSDKTGNEADISSIYFWIGMVKGKVT